MSPEFNRLFSQHVADAFAKQLAFADVLGSRDWGVSIPDERVTFGSDLSFPIQLIGTEAESDSSWLWAWANEGSQLPTTALRICNEMRDFGEQGHIPELVEANYSLETVDGHTLAMVASGMHPECCYYRGPYDGGALFFLVCNAPDEVTQPVATQRAVTLLTETISQFEVDHQVMAESFLTKQGFVWTQDGLHASAKRERDTIQIAFDSQGRIGRVEGTVGRPRPRKLPRWKVWRRS